MNRVAEILAFLRAGEDAVSGDYISSRLAISRTAVWKYMKQLERLGYVIERAKGRGYRLMAAPDRVYPWEIARHCHGSVIGREIVYHDSIDSTNTAAFKIALNDSKDGTCVIAETQRTGRGRLQRKWASPYGKNLYVSVILRPRLHPLHSYPVTFLSSLAVSDTLFSLGLKPTLKWPNDVLVNGKKICGTLLELSTEAEMIRFVVVGIGLNVNMTKRDLPAEVRPKATSLLLETKKHYERAAVCGIVLDNLEVYYRVLQERGVEEICRLWEDRARIRGIEMEVSQMDSTFRGISEGIDRYGALLLRHRGKLIRVIAGDVNI